MGIHTSVPRERAMKAPFTPSILLSATAMLLAACSTDAGVGSSLAPTQGDTATDAGALDNDAASDATGAAQDAGPVDAGLPTPTWKAAVFLHDPLTDGQKLTEVTLAKPTSKDGTLVGQFVEVRNCINEDGGPPIKFQGIAVGSMCVEKQVAKPGSFGDFLYIKPPANYDDPNDPFSELMMYHHVNVMHDYFKNGHGLDQLDKPIQAIVNVQVKLEGFAAQMMGAKPGWTSFPNAAFIPKESFAQFPFLPDRDQDAIVFMQHEKVDFAYDASVIHHEYTHAMVGTTRLNGAFPDAYGMNNLPGAMNEGFADYFAATMDGNPVIGNYALSNQGQHYVRKLTDKRICPDDITTEVHADGRIVGSAMWAIREAIGKDKADTIILSAIQTFTQTTEFGSAAAAIIAEAKKQDAASAPKVEEILKEYGIKDCERVKKWETWAAMGSSDQVPIALQGMNGVPQQQFPAGVPGFVQHKIAVPVGTAGVEITMVAQGGGFGSAAPKINLAINHDKPVLYSAFGGSPSAKFTVPMPADTSLQGGFSITLSGPCLPAKGGDVVFLMMNSGGTANITQTFVTLHKELKGSEANLTNCAK